MKKPKYQDLPKNLKLTRKDVLKKSINRPLKLLRWGDLRGEMRGFHAADTVVVHEKGKAKIMKDRQMVYRDIARDADGLVATSDIS